MKLTKTQTLTIIGANELPENIAGLTALGSIVILFDPDLDSRVFLFVQKHYKDLVPCVRGVYESKGTLTLYLYKEPNKFLQNLIATGAHSPTDSDIWTIEIVTI